MNNTARGVFLRAAAFAALTAFSTAAEAARVEQVIVRQNWPWSTDIRVEYKLTGVTGPVDVSLSAYDGERRIPQADLEAATTGERFAIASSGVYTLTIDPVKMLGTGEIALDDLKVCMDVADSPENLNEVIYKVIRLSDGDCRDLTRADFFNGKVDGGYVTDYKKIDGAYSTTLSDVLIWTGVTNNPAYKSTHIVMRKIKCKGVQWTMGEASTQPYKNTGVPECQVVLTNDFWIGVFPITIGQWKAVGLGGNGRTNGGSNYYPANTNDCAVQVNSTLAARNGIPGSGTQTTEWPKNRHSVDSRSLLGCLRAKTGYDFELPTEAQWEFAARGGVYGEPVYTGERIDTAAKQLYALRKIAWFDENSKVNGTIYRKPVGCLKPNAYGLYDVLGMLAEYILNKTYAYDTENVTYEPEGTDEGSVNNWRSYTYANSYTGQRVGNRLALSSNSFVGVRVILPDFEGLVYPDWDKK
jgi:formylglycine-generating enzyme required for sulfatase activity